MDLSFSSPQIQRTSQKPYKLFLWPFMLDQRVFCGVGVAEGWGGGGGGVDWMLLLKMRSCYNRVKMSDIYKGCSHCLQLLYLPRKKKLTHYYFVFFLSFFFVVFAVSGDNKNSSSFISILMFSCWYCWLLWNWFHSTFVSVCMYVYVSCASSVCHDTPRTYVVWQMKFPSDYL